MKKGSWEISAIYDAIFGARSENLNGTTLFCNYFPSIDDLKLIVSVGIISINIPGAIIDIDPEVIKLLNEINAEEIALEIVQLG